MNQKGHQVCQLCECAVCWVQARPVEGEENVVHMDETSEGSEHHNAHPVCGYLRSASVYLRASGMRALSALDDGFEYMLSSLMDNVHAGRHES
jgi:hypothetical protein